jgi:hypothetical protein
LGIVNESQLLRFGITTENWDSLPCQPRSMPIA